MKKWKKLTVALAGIAACVGLIGSPGYGTGKGRFCKGCIADTDSI